MNTTRDTHKTLSIMENDLRNNQELHAYCTGFNEGYLVTQHYPELSASMSQIEIDLPRMEGFRDGRDQMLTEQAKEYQPKWLRDRPHKAPSENTPDKEKGIDHDL